MYILIIFFVFFLNKLIQIIVYIFFKSRFSKKNDPFHFDKLVFKQI